MKLGLIPEIWVGEVATFYKIMSLYLQSVLFLLQAVFLRSLLIPFFANRLEQTRYTCG